MNYFKFLALLIAPMILLSSCKKSSNTPTAPTVGMSFKVNGTLIKTDSQTARDFAGQGYVIGGFYNNQMSSVVLTLPRAAPATFDVVKDQLILLYYNTVANDGTYYKATSGTVTITAPTATSVSGTFQFTATSDAGVVMNITEGQFTINNVTNN